MYNNPYYQANFQAYGQQNLNDRIDNQIAQLQQMKEQIKTNHQPAINQTFQLAPSNAGMKYANSLDEVSRETIYADTPYFSKDMSVLWVKALKGDIKTYELKEIVPLDEKDMQIQYLQSQIEELKGMIKNESNVHDAFTEQNATDTTTNDESIGTTTKKNKSSSISKISGSEEK